LRKSLDMRKNNIGLFHKAIIASICCLLLSGCGFKADPYWEEQSSVSAFTLVSLT